MIPSETLRIIRAPLTCPAQVSESVWHKRTDVRHLRHPGRVRVPGEARRVVVDVVDLDDELGLALQRLVGLPVDGFGVEDVEGLLLSVQPLGGVDVPRIFIDLEEGPGPLPGEDVLHAAVASVRVGVKLWTNTGGVRSQVGGNRHAVLRWTLFYSMDKIL